MALQCAVMSASHHRAAHGDAPIHPLLITTTLHSSDFPLQDLPQQWAEPSVIAVPTKPTPWGWSPAGGSGSPKPPEAKLPIPTAAVIQHAAAIQHAATRVCLQRFAFRALAPKQKHACVPLPEERAEQKAMRFPPLN